MLTVSLWCPQRMKFRGASSEAHITQADTVGVVDAHVIPGNLSPAQPVITSQLSDSDSSGTLLNSSRSPDNDNSDILFPQPELGFSFQTGTKSWSVHLIRKKTWRDI